MEIDKHRSTDRIVDQYLVLRCQDGDQQSLSLLIRKWQPPFLRFAAFVTKDHDLASDIIQDAWVKIIKGLPRLRDPVSFEAWAYRIINNSCMDVMRKRSRQRKQQQVEILDEEIRANPIDTYVNKDHVQTLLNQLSEKHRSVLALYYLQGFEVDDIARITGSPKGTVKSRLFNAREKFKALLGDSSDEKEKSLSTGEKHEQPGPTDSKCLAGSF